MIIPSESSMLDFGQKFAHHLSLPAVIELVGDVGAGKTTFTRGLALGLGIKDPVTSPSFTISKRYNFSNPTVRNGELVHYDFYRLGDPGIMLDELSETLENPDSVVVVEWGTEVADILPASRIQITITWKDENTRELKINASPEILSQFKELLKMEQTL